MKKEDKFMWYNYDKGKINAPVSIGNKNRISTHQITERVKTSKMVSKILFLHENNTFCTM